jgi:hypothetical protein
MVFTVPVMEQRPGPGRSRRTVLAALVGGGSSVALAGCWGNDRTAPPPKPHPLAPALAGTLQLVARYATTATTFPELTERLQPLLADHRAHVDALRGAMGIPSPSASASDGAGVASSMPADAAEALAGLRTAEVAAQADARTACLAALPEYAPLLGSIAACRATHLEVLGP